MILCGHGEIPGGPKKLISTDVPGPQDGNHRNSVVTNSISSYLKHWTTWAWRIWLRNHFQIKAQGLIKLPKGPSFRRLTVEIKQHLVWIVLARHPKLQCCGNMRPRLRRNFEIYTTTLKFGKGGRRVVLCGAVTTPKCCLISTVNSSVYPGPIVRHHVS